MLTTTVIECNLKQLQIDSGLDHKAWASENPIASSLGWIISATFRPSPLSPAVLSSIQKWAPSFRCPFIPLTFTSTTKLSIKFFTLMLFKGNRSSEAKAPLRFEYCRGRFECAATVDEKNFILCDATYLLASLGVKELFAANIKIKANPVRIDRATSKQRTSNRALSHFARS